MFDPKAYPTLKTSDDAKKQVCPQMMRPGFDPHHPNQRCIGDKCQAWRWGYWQWEVIEVAPQDRTERQKVIDAPGWHYNETERRWERGENRPSHGYCGLAGRPPEVEAP